MHALPVGLAPLRCGEMDAILVCSRFVGWMASRILAEQGFFGFFFGRDAVLTCIASILRITSARAHTHTQRERKRGSGPPAACMRDKHTMVRVVFQLSSLSPPPIPAAAGGGGGANGGLLIEGAWADGWGIGQVACS